MKLMLIKYLLYILAAVGLGCGGAAYAHQEKFYKQSKGERHEYKTLICQRPSVPNGSPQAPFSVPDTGSSVALLGLALTALGFVRKSF
jgi:hypothetical protein